MSMSKLYLLSSSFAKYYVHSYTNSVFPIVCIGVQLPFILDKKQYDHLPFLLISPVGYCAFTFGLQMVEEKNKKLAEEENKKSK